MSAAPPSNTRSWPILLALLAAVAWLVCRVFVGLDFTDEMQYYGEIAALARTGRLFEDDLFVQQLGYLFVLPLFRLHAWLFPDQSYLVVFGRIVLLGGYLAVGWVFWRCAARAGFSRHARLVALAAIWAWVPFQIFALGYNATSYLLGVALVSLWLARNQLPSREYSLGVAAGLTVLTYTYPPAGLTLIAVAAGELWLRAGARRARALVAMTAALGLAVLLVMFARQGPALWSDLAVAARFSRAFGVGAAILLPDHIVSLPALAGSCALFAWRVRAGPQYPGAVAALPARLRWLALAAFAGLGATLFVWSLRWTFGYFPACVFQLGLILLAAAIVPRDADSANPLARSTWNAAAIAMLFAGAVLLMTFIGTGLSTGFFATALHTVLLVLLIVIRPSDSRSGLPSLTMLGALLGTVFAATSGNGLHNFGFGVAIVVPFLVLHLVERMNVEMPPRPLFSLARIAGPLLVALTLVNGALHPYREDLGWTGFARVRDVGAFKGLWISPVKMEALQRLRGVVGPPGGPEKSILVAGPHPWLYFAAGGRPTTSMFYMHFGAPERVFDIVAQRLLRNAPPDVIVLPNRVPRIVHQRIVEWASLGYEMKTIPLPGGFVDRYNMVTRQDLLREVIVLHRAAAATP